MERENLILIIVIAAILTSLLTLLVQMFYSRLQRKGVFRKIQPFTYLSVFSFSVSLLETPWLQITLRWYFDAKFLLTEMEKAHYNNLFYRAIEGVMVQNECSVTFYQSTDFIDFLVKDLQELAMDSTKKNSIFQMSVSLEKQCPRTNGANLCRVLYPKDLEC